MNVCGRLISSTETLAKDGGPEMNMDVSLKENTEKHSANEIAILTRQAALKRYMILALRVLKQSYFEE